MNKLNFSKFCMSRYAGALLLAHMASINAIYTAEVPQIDNVHNDVMRKLFHDHGISQEYFKLSADQPVPIFDIQAHSRKIHEQQISYLQNHSPHLLPLNIPNTSQQSSSSWGSIFYTPIAFAGRVIYAPFTFASNTYFYLTSSKSDQKACPAAQILPPSSFEEHDDFVLIENDKNRKSAPGPQDEKSTASSPPQPTSPPVKAESSPAASAPIAESPATVASTIVDGGTRGKKLPQIILSFDGGGGRGYISGLEVKYLEGELKAKVNDFAYLIGGTSIGGVEAIGYAMGVMDGSAFVDLFDTKFDQIFPKHSSWNVLANLYDDVRNLWYARYDSKPFEILLQEYLGAQALATTKCNVLITAVDILTNNPCRITNRANPTMLAWQGARSTSAAPLYFAPFENMIDGGVWANNPAYEAYLEAQLIASSENVPWDPIVISFGTGKAPISPIPNNAGILNGVGGVIDAFIASQVNGTDETMSKLLMRDKTYFRLNPNLTQGIPLDQFYEVKDILTKAAETQYPALDKIAELDAIRLKLEAKDYSVSTAH